MPERQIFHGEGIFHSFFFMSSVKDTLSGGSSYLIGNNFWSKSLEKEEEQKTLVLVAWPDWYSFPHSSQINGPFSSLGKPLWTSLMWSLRFSWPRKFSPQWGQSHPIFIWTCSMCIFTWYLLGENPCHQLNSILLASYNQRPVLKSGFLQTHNRVCPGTSAGFFLDIFFT